MKDKPQTSRTGAAKPCETEHLTESQKHALDIQAEAEHTDGTEREVQTRKMQRLGEGKMNPRKN